MFTGHVAMCQGIPGQNSRNFQYLSYALVDGITSGGITVTPTVSAWNSVNVPKWYALAVTSTATGAFQVQLEGSVDQLRWKQLAVTNTASAQAGMAVNTAAIPSLYFRMRAPIMPNGGTITATAIGSW